MVKAIIWRALLLTAIAAALLLVFGLWAWARGAALGGLASAVNFWLMAAWLPGTIVPGRGKAEAKSLLSLVGRFAVMGAALAVALLFPDRFKVAATAAGLFAVQITILLGRLLGPPFRVDV